MSRNAADPSHPPRGVDTGAWALRCALREAVSRLPYAAAEARLLDGLERWVRAALRGPGQAAPGATALVSAGPAWAAVLHAVAAVAALASDDTRGLLAPWLALVPAPPRSPGVAPPTAGFRPLAGPGAA